MPKKKSKKAAKTKEVKGQLGKKKETAREKMIGQSIGYRYDVNLLPDYSKLTPILKKYIPTYVKIPQLNTQNLIRRKVLYLPLFIA